MLKAQTVSNPLSCGVALLVYPMWPSPHNTSRQAVLREGSAPCKLGNHLLSPGTKASPQKKWADAAGVTLCALSSSIIPKPLYSTHLLQHTMQILN